MPDVTSTLLAMYQSIIGGSSAREQSSLEAECARRVLVAGITITGQTVTIPSLVINGGFVNGNWAVSGTLTVGHVTCDQLVVNATAIVTGLLTANGGLTVNNGSLTSNGNFVCAGTAVVTGQVTANGGLAVNGGNGVFAGLLQVSGFGQSTWVGSGAGIHGLALQNTAAGTANQTAIYLGNDTTANLVMLQAMASTFTSNALNLANGGTLYCGGAGGLSVCAGAASGVLRFYSGGMTERMRLLATGELCINTTTNAVGSGQVAIVADQAHTGLVVQNSNPANGINFVAFMNSAAAVAGIISQTSANSVSYGTSSDARLKDDAGRATDLTALRGVVVHDFTWKADGTRDRGVFAQEAQRLFPRAVLPGTDETTAEGDLARPWQTDYAKFVPDLIVGWQQHDAELAALRTLLGRRVA